MRRHAPTHHLYFTSRTRVFKTRVISPSSPATGPLNSDRITRGDRYPKMSMRCLHPLPSSKIGSTHWRRGMNWLDSPLIGRPIGTIKPGPKKTLMICRTFMRSVSKHVQPLTAREYTEKRTLARESSKPMKTNNLKTSAIYVFYIHLYVFLVL